MFCFAYLNCFQISFWCSSLAHSFKHQSISTPNSSLIVHFTVLAVYTHSKLVFGLFAFITIRIKDQHGILLHQITFGASISPSSHFFLFRAHFSGWFLYFSSLLVFPLPLISFCFVLTFLDDFFITALCWYFSLFPFSLSFTHFSEWFLCYRFVLVFLSLPIFFVFYSLFWMISLLRISTTREMKG